MEWTPDMIHLLRLHLGDTQEAFRERLGLKRRQTVSEWELGKEHPGGIARRLLDIIANDAGFTERVAARLKVRIERDQEE